MRSFRPEALTPPCLGVVLRMSLRDRYATEDQSLPKYATWGPMYVAKALRDNDGSDIPGKNKHTHTHSLSLIYVYTCICVYNSLLIYSFFALLIWGLRPEGHAVPNRTNAWRSRWPSQRVPGLA